MRVALFYLVSAAIDVDVHAGRIVIGSCNIGREIMLFITRHGDVALEAFCR